MTTILVLGRTGQIGWELTRCLSPLGNIIAADRKMFDLNDHQALSRGITALQPQIIINAAADTNVDGTERENTPAQRVNAEAPAVLAEIANHTKALLVHYSTDYVFDGEKLDPYVEDDPVAPLNRYGEIKLAAERAIMSSGARYLIFRTSWVYGQRGRNFLNTILRLAREREELRIVGDQIGAPTWCRMIAQTTALALAHMIKAPNDVESGIYHLSASGTTSWHGFAEAIVERARRMMVPQALRVQQIQAINSADFITAARRPLNSRLACTKLERQFGLVMPHWLASLDLCMASDGAPTEQTYQH